MVQQRGPFHPGHEWRFCMLPVSWLPWLPVPDGVRLPRRRVQALQGVRLPRSDPSDPVYPQDPALRGTSPPPSTLPPPPSLRSQPCQMVFVDQDGRLVYWCYSNVTSPQHYFTHYTRKERLTIDGRKKAEEQVLYDYSRRDVVQ
uniref:(northern house mosquito) hypothetical protein n=1 Tax=Culex pipiens TaxID=7175 RepID=A0A8D8P4C4_CULPI